MFAICLSLDKRKEEWLKLKEECSAVGIDMIPFIAGDGSDASLEYDHIDKDPTQYEIAQWGYSRPGFQKHHINAFKCHQLMVKKAKDMGLPYVLFLEDDAYITDRFSDVFNEIQFFVDYCQWNFIYLGWWIGNETDEWNTKLEEEYKDTKKVNILSYTKNIGGLHGVLISASIYDLLLGLKPTNPIDCQLNMLVEYQATSPLLTRFVVTPKIIHVKSIYSHCEGSVIQRKVI